MLGQFTGQEKSDSGLDFSACDGGSPVVVGQTGGLSGDSLEDIIYKTVHDIHGFAGNTGIGMYLLQHLVDVDSITFPPPPLPFLIPSSLGLSLGGGLLRSFTCWFRWHLVT